MRAEKQLLLDEIQEKVESNNTFIITRYEGLSANLANEFRGLVESTGGEFEVVRKRIFLKALQASKIDIDPQMLEGHVGVVFAKEDPIDTTKAIFKFGKAHSKHLSVSGGRFEGTIYDAASVKKLSELPSKDEMRSELLSVFEAPMSQTLAVMEALLTSVIFCLDNKVKLEESKI
jgi:large subunit ribosomal protein L10